MVKKGGDKMTFLILCKNVFSSYAQSNMSHGKEARKSIQKCDNSIMNVFIVGL